MFLFLHYYNRRLISRMQFNDENDALTHANIMMAQAYLNGFHELLVIERDVPIFHESFKVEGVKE